MSIKSLLDNIDIADESLSVQDVVTFFPLMQEAKRLQSVLVNGGALHIILEDGNYQDSNIQYCIEHIQSGEYAKSDYCDDEELDGQLIFAKALLPLTEQQREMVCENKTCTEDLFNLVMNHDHVERQ